MYFGHNTWNTYYSTIRIIKEYNLNYNNRWVKSKNIIFTSYPATMSSLDDFYLSSHGLVTIETTNIFYNDTLFNEITPEALFTCERAMVSNRISNSSKEWTENFKKYNSGTYNNQFMVLDKNKVNLVNKSIENDAFYIVEQLSLIQEVIDSNPSAAASIDYDNCARTKIFRREQSSADNLEGFMRLMRYNKYLTDPYSDKNPSSSISARSDLRGSCSGAYDSKVGVLSDFSNGKVKFRLIGGPTWSEEDGIEPFSWSKAVSEKCRNHVHNLIPEIFKYDWIVYENEFPF